VRILIDRLWPRGVTKEKAAVDEWMKELAPSAELRRWFGHDPAKWSEFQTRYRKELSAHRDVLESLAKKGTRRRVTLVYGARDEEHNDAVVLRDVLEEMRRKA
jgi:uncharacterized protein YeaO (DUF488 family)